MDNIWLAMAIVVAAYLIGDGLKNFKNPNSKNILDTLDYDHELINENEVHHFLGISKEDTKSLISEHPNIPHIIINNKVYYPKVKLREWLMKIGS
ncbi:hypothetical protein J2S74_005561 [Evansella vedderi]|uniref:DNA-binding protein n=1 Tax=Evansella vedderi TaxID=38282 RepID=A0ABU0A3M5_9BACI|nr:DNA-binding protein [Evansella vedderi]MDQ0258096.1 hypothetical protein [Evansella vedderi]